MPSINVRAKGANGEREIADALNYIIYQQMKLLGMSEQEALKGMTTVQRNQNQSAVGGNDLTNVLGLSVEVKRQETLSIPAWWRQCVVAANRNNEVPVLVYRQNRKAWQVMTKMFVPLPNGSQVPVEAIMSFEDFKKWFALWAFQQIAAGYEVRT